MPRHAELVVDLDAIRHNVAALAAAAPDSALCAVVKADGYGHGAVPVARAALDAGAELLAVALVEEGEVLRGAGIAAPILLLSEPPIDCLADAHRSGLTPTLYSAEGIAEAARVAAAGADPWPVHLKVDTGMHRVGADPDDVATLLEAIDESPSLELQGIYTHLAVADEPDRPETALQLERFDEVLAAAASTGPRYTHAANSAGTIAHPRARMDLVRVGIAMYGIAPSEDLATVLDLRPAMSLNAQVSYVKHVAAGEGVSYGLRHHFDHDAIVAVVPLGYADGVPRRLSGSGAAVLIGGVRRPIRGVVTMDQLMVEVTDGPPVSVGDEVVLLGSQGSEQVLATEWAERVGTIGYEIVCGFGSRLPRRHVGEGAGQ